MAVCAQVPQYPLYSATATLLNGTLAPYYLDESANWGVHRQELERSLQRAAAMGARAHALVVINPGNPTGQSLPEEVVEGMLRFAAAEHLVLMADEARCLQHCCLQHAARSTAACSTAACSTAACSTAACSTAACSTPPAARRL